MRRGEATAWSGRYPWNSAIPGTGLVPLEPRPCSQKPRPMPPSPTRRRPAISSSPGPVRRGRPGMRRRPVRNGAPPISPGTCAAWSTTTTSTSTTRRRAGCARLMATGAQPAVPRRASWPGRTRPSSPRCLTCRRPSTSPRSPSRRARYAARIGPLLGLPHHRYRGRVITVAGMAGVACVEWHLHAWDLARALGHRATARPTPTSCWLAWLAGAPPAAAGCRALRTGDPGWPVLRASGPADPAGGSRVRPASVAEVLRAGVSTVLWSGAPPDWRD